MIVVPYSDSVDSVALDHSRLGQTKSKASKEFGRNKYGVSGFSECSETELVINERLYGESSWQLLVQNVRHSIWVTFRLLPVYGVSVMGICGFIWGLFLVNSGWQKYFYTMVVIAFTYSFGALLSTTFPAGKFRAVVGSVACFAFFCISEYYLASKLFPDPKIILVTGAEVVIATLLAYSIVTKPTHWIIIVLVALCLASTVFIGAYYIYFVSTVTLTALEEVAICGFGYYLLVMILGRIVFADFMKFALGELFPANETSLESTIGFTFFAKISFSMPQTFALLQLQGGFLSAVLVSNILELVLVVFNIMIVRKGIAKYCKRDEEENAQTERPKMTTVQSVAQFVDKRPNLRLFVDWLTDFKDYNDNKICVLMFGEELGDRLNSVAVSIGYIFYSYYANTPPDEFSVVVERCLLLMGIEFVEDILKAQLILYTSGIAFFKIPDGAISLRSSFVACFHGITVFCIITLGTVLTEQQG